MTEARHPSLSLVGASYHSAPVDLRERLAFPEDQLPEALTTLRAQVRECLILSTCNRTEVYIGDEAVAASPKLLAGLRGMAESDLDGSCYVLRDDEVVRHLLRVASGIDSMVLGETQILGQVRDALEMAARAGTIGRTLGRVLPLALEVGKRARAETGISRGALSPSSVAVEAARQELGHLEALVALVVGAGDAGTAAARSLKAAGVDRILIANRSSERGAELARSVGADALPYVELDRALAEADIVIASTGASEHVIGVEMVREALWGRKRRPLLCLDIAMPRDIDPAVAELPGVVLHNIDDLEAVCSANLRERANEITAVENIVEEGVADYAEWRAVEALVPTISTLYQRADEIRRAELERTVSRLEDRLSDEDRELIDVMTAAIVRRLLHTPVAALKARGSDPKAAELAGLTRELFALPEDGVDP